ncbi:MAG: radical SAM protein [Rhodospirillaceae bacterium]
MFRPDRIIKKSLFINTLPEDLLTAEISSERARRLFSRYVVMVELENHSYCNRVCWFCPNSHIDRRSTNILMSDVLFDKVMADLSSIKYSRDLVWAGYHEPLAHESIFPRLARARQTLPAANLCLISNGDYLNREMVATLEQAGLNFMLSDLYLPDGREDDEEEQEKALKQFAKRTGLEPVKKGPRRYDVIGCKFKINMSIPHFKPESMSTRGGSMAIDKTKTYDRRSACFSPVRGFVVNYNGKCMICCQTRSDVPEHAEAIAGDLNVEGYSLFDCYRDLGPIRRGLLAPGLKTGPCRSCDVSDDAPDLLARRPLLARLLKTPGIREKINRAFEPKPKGPAISVE